MSADGSSITFVALPLFERSRKGVLSDEDVEKVKVQLEGDPRAGKVVAGTGGVRKLRAARSGQGKRGGARVLYYYVDVRSTVYLMLAYAKNAQSDLSEAQKRALLAMVDIVKRGS